jgi:hypothetical protein
MHELGIESVSRRSLNILKSHQVPKCQIKIKDYMNAKNPRRNVQKPV